MSAELPALAEQRRAQILQELRRSGGVHVTQMAIDLHVSEMTVRRDIAALAKRGLVTRVHGGATLPASIREAVHQEVDEPTFTFGLVVPSLVYYWPAIIEGAKLAAARHRGRLVVRGSSYQAADNLTKAKALVNGLRLDGLIIAPTMDGPETGELVDWINHLRLPVVLAERTSLYASQRHIDSVCTDHRYGMRMAVQHLVEQGHRGIGLLMAATPHHLTLADGWRSAVAEFGVTPTMEAEAIEFDDPHRDAKFVELMATIRRTHTTALIVHSDPHAVGLAQYCFDNGTSVPGELALVAFDDEVAYLGPPPLTAVSPAKQHVGAMCVETLLNRLREDPQRPAHRLMIEPSLVVRESSLKERP